jgi:hypothetical protein
VELTEAELRLITQAEKTKWSGRKKWEICLILSSRILFLVFLVWMLREVYLGWLHIRDSLVCAAEDRFPRWQEFVCSYYELASMGVLFGVLFAGFIWDVIRSLWALPFRRNNLQNHQHLILRLVERLRETGELLSKPGNPANSYLQTPSADILASPKL